MNTEQERKDFEAWAVQYYGEFEKDADGEYMFSEERSMFEAWQARAAKPLPVDAIHTAIVSLQYVMDTVIGRDQTHHQFEEIESALSALRALIGGHNARD